MAIEVAPLFRGEDVESFLADFKSRLLAEVERYPAAALVTADIEQLAQELAASHACAPVALHRDRLEQDHEEAELSIDEVPDGQYLDDDGDGLLRGMEYSWHVPFEGEQGLFHSAASRWTTTFPKAEVRTGVLVFARRVHVPDEATLNAYFDRAYKQTLETLRGHNARAERFNAQLVGDARVALIARRDKLAKAGVVAAAMKYPLKRRDDAPPTYAVELPKKRVAVPVDAPEAVVAMADYEDILRVMESMARMLERSPNAFRRLKEEELRDFFLVYLNGQYDGGASGETFNFRGKTDILISAQGRTIFIAECKFWSGPSNFTDTIDQLLGYLSWRDTKVAILSFNRGTQMSTVVRQIPGLLEGHAHFKQSMEQQGETRFRATFRQPNDPEREVILTVLVFDVPGAS